MFQWYSPYLHLGGSESTTQKVLVVLCSSTTQIDQYIAWSWSSASYNKYLVLFKEGVELGYNKYLVLFKEGSSWATTNNLSRVLTLYEQFNKYIRVKMKATLLKRAYTYTNMTYKESWREGEVHCSTNYFLQNVTELFNWRAANKQQQYILLIKSTNNT